MLTGVEAREEEALWSLLAQLGKPPGRTELVEHHHLLLDVVWLAESPSFATPGRWTRFLQPLLIASEHFGAAVRTVCSREINSQSANDFSTSLRGSLLLLDAVHLEMPHSGEAGKTTLTADAGTRVFDMLAQWRGCMLLPMKNESGELEHLACRIRLDTLAAGVSVHDLPARQSQHAQAVYQGKSAKRNPDSVTAQGRAGPLAHGMPSNSSYLRAWKVVNAKSIPTHLDGISYSLIVEPLSEGDGKCKSMLNRWMECSDAAIMGYLETWQEKAKLSMEQLRAEDLEEREARQKCQREHVLHQHTSSSSGAGARPNGMVSRRLVVLRRDVKFSDRLLVSTFRWEYSAHLMDGLRSLAPSLAPYVPNLYQVSDCPRPGGHASINKVAGAGTCRSKSSSEAVATDFEMVATVLKKRPAWCGDPLFSQKTKRARTECNSSCGVSPEKTAAATCANRQVEVTCGAGEANASADTPAAPQPVRQKVASGLAEDSASWLWCFGVMADADTAIQNADDMMLSGGVEDMTQKQLPNSKAESPSKRKLKSGKPSNSASKLSNAHRFEKSKEFVATVRAHLNKVGYGFNKKDSWQREEHDQSALFRASVLNPTPSVLLFDHFHQKSPTAIANEWCRAPGPHEREHGIDLHFTLQDGVGKEDAIQRAKAVGEAPDATEEVKACSQIVQDTLLREQASKQCVDSSRQHSNAEGGSAIDLSLLEKTEEQFRREEARVQGSLFIVDARILPSPPKKLRHSTKNDPQRPMRPSTDVHETSQRAQDKLPNKMPNAKKDKQKMDTGNKPGRQLDIRAAAVTSGAQQGGTSESKQPSNAYSTTAVSANQSMRVRKSISSNDIRTAKASIDPEYAAKCLVKSVCKESLPDLAPGQENESFYQLYNFALSSLKSLRNKALNNIGEDDLRRMLLPLIDPYLQILLQERAKEASESEALAAIAPNAAGGSTAAATPCMSTNSGASASTASTLSPLLAPHTLVPVALKT